LSGSAKQKTVPTSQIGRMISFGGLAAGLGIGAVTEMTKRTLGVSNSTKKNEGGYMESAFISPENAERIANTLCEVRGLIILLYNFLGNHPICDLPTRLCWSTGFFISVFVVMEILLYFIFVFQYLQPLILAFTVFGQY